MKRLPPPCSPLRTALEIMAEGPRSIWVVDAAFFGASLPRASNGDPGDDPIMMVHARAVSALMPWLKTAWASPGNPRMDSMGHRFYELDADTAARVRAAA